MSKVIHLKSTAEWEAKLAETSAFGGKGMLVDFTATWCGPCQVIGPVFERLSSQFANIMFVKVDVDELQEVAQACGVRAMPTFQSYRNGAKFEDDLVGADPGRLQQLAQRLSAALAPVGPGLKLGGEGSSAAVPEDDMAARRRRMAEAAEARMRAGGSS